MPTLLSPFTAIGEITFRQEMAVFVGQFALSDNRCSLTGMDVLDKPRRHIKQRQSRQRADRAILDAAGIQTHYIAANRNSLARWYWVAINVIDPENPYRAHNRCKQTASRVMRGSTTKVRKERWKRCEGFSHAAAPAAAKPPTPR